MAINTGLNLIQVQSDLQAPGIEDKDLIKYANGENPKVPAFLALMEMNRRKQIEEGSKNYDASNQKTIKDQLTSALMSPTQLQGGLGGLPAGQVNPTAAPPGVNMGIASPGINPAAAPQQVDPTMAPPQPDTGPMPAINAAYGGLMSLPVNHFNANSYAGGGIVAFSGGDVVEGNPDPKQYTHDSRYRMLPNAAPDYGLIAAAQDQSDAERIRLLHAEQMARIKAGHPKLESAGTSLMILPTDEPPTPKAAPAPAAGSYQGILAGLPQVQPIAMTAPEQKSPEQVFQGIKENQRLAGVAENPYSEVEKRQAAMEARQQKAYEQGGLDRLMAQLSAFAKADPAKGLGYAGAIATEASQVLEREQQALRDKQESAQIEFHKGLAKEEDGKRRGNATAIQSGLDAQRKAQEDFAKLVQQQQRLGVDQQTVAAHIYHTQESAANQREANKNTAKYQEGMLGYHNRMADISEDQKPTAEDKKLLKVQTTVNGHPVVRSIADSIKQGVIQPGTPEYYDALRKINEIARPLYKQAGLPEPEDIVGSINEAPGKKPGLVKRIFGGSNAPATNTMPKGWTVQTNP